MVQQATKNESQAWGALPSSKEIAVRKISSIFLMAILLTVITPFSPFTWIIPSSGPEVLDQFLAPPLYLGALFFQWRIAGVVGNLLVNVMDMAFVYHHNMYWMLAFGEVLLVGWVNWLKNEIVRRVVACGVVAALWGIGWFATPNEWKKEAWVHLKWVWTMMAFDKARGAIGGGRRYC